MKYATHLLSLFLAVILVIAAAACQRAAPAAAPPATSLPTSTPTSLPTATPAPSPTAVPTIAPSPTPAWTETDVTFPSGPDTLTGILTLPTGPGPYPAIALMSGSEDPGTGGKRPGASDPVHTKHAERLVLDGYAVLRYDPPGVGGSTDNGVRQGIKERADEAIAAARYLRSRPDIRDDRVGLWGVSQGGWVVGMAAAEAPEDIAFIISASGSGVSVPDQQVYGVETQTRASGASEEDVARAGLIIRLLNDWQFAKPLYTEASKAAVERFGPGPWKDLYDLVYNSSARGTPENLARVITILELMQDESWARSLYLRDLWLPALRAITPEQLAAARAEQGQPVSTDPKDYLTRVHCPVLAVFGEEDLLVPAQKSAELYAKYLAQAGNRDVTIKVFPGVGHSLGNFMPAYWDMLSRWLQKVKD
jgi:uncharacterized protein